MIKTLQALLLDHDHSRLLHLSDSCLGLVLSKHMVLQLADQMPCTVSCRCWTRAHASLHQGPGPELSAVRLRMGQFEQPGLLQPWHSGAICLCVPVCAAGPLRNLLLWSPYQHWTSHWQAGPGTAGCAWCRTLVPTKLQDSPAACRTLSGFCQMC